MTYCRLIISIHSLKSDLADLDQANSVIQHNPEKEKKYYFLQNGDALKKYFEGIFRRDFFKTTSTHRDTSIAHVFDDFGPPETPHTPSGAWEVTQILAPNGVLGKTRLGPVFG